MERLDPKHRGWGHRAPALFNTWLKARTPLSFWDWLEQTKQADVPGVQYLAPDERWKYWIVFDDRKMHEHDASRALKVFSTKGLRTEKSGANFAIWVCSPGGAFYSASHVFDRFHHSSFLAGDPLARSLTPTRSLIHATSFGVDGRMRLFRIGRLDGLDHALSLALDSGRRLLVGRDRRV
jgi:hypothetical protein